MGVGTEVVALAILVGAHKKHNLIHRLVVAGAKDGGHLGASRHLEVEALAKSITHSESFKSDSI